MTIPPGCRVGKGVFQDGRRNNGRFLGLIFRPGDLNKQRFDVLHKDDVITTENGRVNLIVFGIRVVHGGKHQSPLSGFHRRMKARRGAAEGLTATAHKPARNIYRLIKHGETYVRQGLEDCEKKFKARKLNVLQKTAKAVGFDLVQKLPLPSGVS